jgi:excisionase family DNA binding protein
MQFSDVSHYVSRTDKQHRSTTALVAPERPRVLTIRELALEDGNSLSNSNQFCAKLLTGTRPPGYGALLDSLSFCASMPTLWVVNKNKCGERCDGFTAQFLLKNAGENCGQIGTSLLRCVSHKRLKHPPVVCHYLLTRLIAAGHGRWEAMTSLLSISDVQDRLCVSRSTVNRLIRDQKLECVYIGRSPRIPDDAVERLISKLRDGTLELDENEAQA